MGSKGGGPGPPLQPDTFGSPIHHPPRDSTCIEDLNVEIKVVDSDDIVVWNEKGIVVNEGLMIGRAISTPWGEENEMSQRHNIFYNKCMIKERVCTLVVDGASCDNLVSDTLVKEMNLRTLKHPKPYTLQWLNECGELKVNKMVKIPFIIGEYKDEVICSVVKLHACHLILGRPWLYDRYVTHDGRKNQYTFEQGGKLINLSPLKPNEVLEEQMRLKSSLKATTKKCVQQAKDEGEEKQRSKGVLVDMPREAKREVQRLDESGATRGQDESEVSLRNKRVLGDDTIEKVRIPTQGATTSSHHDPCLSVNGKAIDKFVGTNQGLYNNYSMGSKDRCPPPSLWSPPPGSVLVHPDPFGPLVHPPPRDLAPFDMIPPEIMEKKLASQHLEMQKIVTENQRLASTYGTSRQEVAAAQHDLQLLHAQIEAIKSDKEQRTKDLKDKIAMMEGELQAGENINLALQQARGEAQTLLATRQELKSKVQQLYQDFQKAHSDVQQIPPMLAELETLKQEYQHCRATYDYERKLNNDYVESLQLMEKNYMNMAGEMEKLRAELTKSVDTEGCQSGVYGHSTGYGGSHYTNN